MNGYDLRPWNGIEGQDWIQVLWEMKYPVQQGGCTGGRNTSNGIDGNS